MTRNGTYSAPGGLTDLSDFGRKAWDVFVSDNVDYAIKGPDSSQVLHDSPRPQFYNLTKTETAADARTATVSWTAFPRILKVNSTSDLQRWKKAEASRKAQDEYCEWSVTRTDGKVTRVTFTCEGPEYWDVLAKTSPDTALSLYRRYISPEVQESDLFVNGEYDRYNKWNSTTTHGAMHLIQKNNTLAAEIELAAAATIRRVIDGRELTAEQELCLCSDYGQPERNSDPHIGGSVNALARQKASITLADPVGLYFDGLSTEGWATPDGSDPQSYWTYERGEADHRVRAVYEVPTSKPFTVGDITIHGRPIQYGAQIADFVTIKLTAVACRFGQSTAEPRTACKEVATTELARPEEAFVASAFSAYGYLGTAPARAMRPTRNA
ncbi:hypothetical protein SLV14_007614 [Streptomyces sp. Je 1-4]|uniref:hypothetical protein n=1 Tax=Streptomyces TaxID=1883 RepID=UPI00140F0EA6|nr:MULTISPECIES: hypothetical protein [unclassified Streptomyces]QIK10704.1 hypothetical protein G7Z12_36235 [Streptomyces sp. ID38640]UYB44517.1 hypothetical protein SLV14_007614 [Streptomyces sp. Je 1-4]UZQ40979.1 hypothetical protein SLV14N_007614 [Streptomyces sp. Je 1-4] [Streptomyces sp. Je 1-4 4N24]UZQ48396.1 hypothetical protein SLV14NA_007614 [Streptomyces sp. Je 1-4] [Streptomyces sp. Je 1-4 4N24_ara]